jgi:hypothetical protein
MIEVRNQEAPQAWTTMDVNTILAQLRQEREQIDEAILKFGTACQQR